MVGNYWVYDPLLKGSNRGGLTTRGPPSQRGYEISTRSMSAEVES